MWHLIALIYLLICMDQGYAAGRAEFVGNVSGLVEIVQEAHNSSIEVTGNMIGLPSGQFELKLVKGVCGGDLENIGGHERLQSAGEEEPVRVGFVRHGKNVGQGLDSFENLSLVVNECVRGVEWSEGGSDCDVGVRLGCANIVLEVSKSQLYEELSLPFIDASLPPASKIGQGLEMDFIIIIVAFTILLLIIICILIICCCVRKRSKKKLHVMEQDLDSMDDPFQLDGRSKSQMYDELSLPFIDASLPPSPKIGRTVNGFYVLLGNNTGSINSFVDY